MGARAEGGVLTFGDWVIARVSEFLSKPIRHYERRGWNDFNRLKKVIRKGDVLLVEGDQRVSAIIKYLTQSSWSHAALYIGDELLKVSGEVQDGAHEAFGDEANHLVVEALSDGVVASPLMKYVDFNVRLTRPHRLQADDLKTIQREAIEAIGWRYDVRNITDLATFLLRGALRPDRHPLGLQLGSDATTEVICTSLLGRLFHGVHFPVLPSVTFPEGAELSLTPPRRSLFRLLQRDRKPYAPLFRKRHPTLLTPRDFDLSPYFDVVKFNLIQGTDFDYRRMEWEDQRQRTA